MVFGLFNIFGKRNSIIYKGKKYTRDFLRKVIDDSYKKEPQTFTEPNFDLNIDIYAEGELTQKDIDSFNQWKIKSKAQSWKSRQRHLKREGKLEQYKIDALNRLGMIWNPQRDEWEHYYKALQDHGMCEFVKDWVIEQRRLYEENNLNRENLLRLNAIKFPFKASSSEKFPLARFQAYRMIDAMDEGKKKYEYKFVKYVQVKRSEPKVNQKLSERKLNKLKKEIDALFNRKKSPSEYGLGRNVDIDIYYDAFKYLNGYEENSQGKKIKFICPDEIKIYAAEKSIELLDKKLLKLRWFKEVKGHLAISKFITYYDKKRNAEKMYFIKNLIEKHPILNLVYEDRMKRVMKKYEKKY